MKPEIWIAPSKHPPVVGCDADASQPVRFARDELQRYLGQILNALPGTQDGARIRLAVDFNAGLSDEGFEIWTEGSTLHICGGSGLGVLFGAYTFLREVCGCQFSGFGADSEFVPRKSEITFAGCIRREPKLWYRGLQFSVRESPELNRARIDWMAKNGLNFVMVMLAHEAPEKVVRTEVDPRTGAPLLDGDKRTPRITESWFNEHLLPEIQKRGLKLDMNHHNLRYWLPTERYLKQHPEWFAETNGERGKTFNQLFICTTNEQAVQTIVENVLDYLRTHPDTKIVGVIPEDGWGCCQCARCRAEDPWPVKTTRPDHHSDDAENPALMLRYAKLINRVARAVRESFPYVLVGCASYIDMQWPPRGVELESNVVAWVAVYWRDGARPLAASATSPYNEFFYDLLRKWKAAFRGRLILYEYYMGMNAQRSLPYPMSRVLCREWPGLRRLGVEGATVQCLVSCDQAYALNLLAFARCGWEGNVDPGKLLNDFLLGMYGSVAEHVRPIYQGLLDAMDRLASIPPGDEMNAPPEISGAVLQPAGNNVGYFLRTIGPEKIQRALSAALLNAKCDRERRQVKDLREYVRYWELAAAVSELECTAKANIEKDSRVATASLRKLVDDAAPVLIAHLESIPRNGWIAASALARWEAARDQAVHTLQQMSDKL